MQCVAAAHTHWDSQEVLCIMENQDLFLCAGIFLPHNNSAPYFLGQAAPTICYGGKTILGRS